MCKKSRLFKIAREIAGRSRVLDLVNIILRTTSQRKTTTAQNRSKLQTMDKININYPEEKVLRLFTNERKPLTAAYLLDYLKSLDFGGGQYILQSLVRKKLLQSKTMNDATLYYPTHQAYYYYAKSGGLRDDTIEVDNKELRRMTLLLEQLDTVEEAKKTIEELKLAKQHKVIELWKTVEQHDTVPADQASDQPGMDDDELDCNAMIIEVKDTAVCATDELETHPELKALTERKIEQLHRYNEIKDFAHALLGVLAEEQLTTVKQLYSVFNIEL